MDKNQLLGEGFQKSRIQTESFQNGGRDPWVSSVEGFDGIRKNNSRKIFGILLIIIVVDFAIELLV